jgi:hypothetical protein
MVQAEVVNINSADNSVQVRVHGYQDDKGNIPDERLEWVKVLGSHAGIAGATGTHNLYVGSKVMLGMSGMEKFVMGSVTGYDSDKSKDKEGADDSDNTDPNVPRIVRGPKPPGNRDISVGEGEDKTSKGTRKVEKTDKQYDTEEAQKIFDYAKQIAPFTKGKNSKFPDLMSIGIDKLKQGSNVLDTIDGMDDNISGAIKAGTKIIRNMEKGGFGDALSLLNGGGGGGGGAADQATKQVVEYHGNIELMELLSALKLLLEAARVLKAATHKTTSAELIIVPQSLQYVTFGVSIELQTSIQESVVKMDTTAPAPKIFLLAEIREDFHHAFGTAMANAVAWIAQLVDSVGTVAVLIQGTTNLETLQELIGTLQAGAAAVGIPAQAINAIGGGVLGQIIQQGAGIIPQIMQQGQQALGQIQQMMEKMNTFGALPEAMKEIMGGGASIDESLTGIVMKYVKKKVNLDGKGFTK